MLVLALIVVSLLQLVVVACGGEEAGRSTTAPPTTSAQTQVPAPERAPAPSHTAIGRAQGTEDLAAYLPAILAGAGPYFGSKQRELLIEELENPSYSTHSWFVTIRQQLAFELLKLGRANEAVGLLNDALDSEERDHPEGTHRRSLLQDLVVTNLKLGELTNCLTPEGSLICALPLDTSLAQPDQQGSTAAIKYLLELLEMDPEDIRSRWLLNIAHMTLGTYPEQVPDRFVIPPELLDSGYDVGRFREIAPFVGLYKINLAGGSIVEDFDNDGLLDIITSTWDPGGEITYYHNDGNGSFSDYTERAGLTGQVGGLNNIQTDYNNDGWMDVLVMRGGWMRLRGQMRVSLLRNNGGETFTDVTHEAGIAYPAYPSQTAGWADYDADGDLDLFACSESQPESEGQASSMMFPSLLFRNEGDGTFIDVTLSAGVANLRYCKGSIWGDYDNDGDPDLYASNFGSDNRLYRNNGDGTFTDVASDLGVVEPFFSFATWFWDYNNDGWLDLFVAGYGYRVSDVAADYLGLPNKGARMRLYRNDGAGGFEDVTRETGLYRVHLTMAANFGDLDNDGWPDFYLGTGYPSYDVVVPNIAYRNNDGESFTDVTFSAGLGHLAKGHGIGFGDIDRDGDQDIFSQLGGFYPGDGFSNALYENPGHGNSWLTLRLVGTESNRAAIGARIKLDLEMTDGSRRAVYAHVSSGGSFGASPLEQEIGLGRARRIASLEVQWPTTGRRQLFEDVPLDSHLEVREDDSEFKLLDIQPFRLQSPR